MQSANWAEVEAVKDGLLKAGIPFECRSNPVADNLGLTAMELWLKDERDVFPAAEICTGTLDRPPAGNGRSEPAPRAANGSRKAGDSEPDHENLEQASSVLEREIEGLLEREQALLSECAGLRGKVKDLGHVLAEAQTSLTRETENRSVLERKQAEKLSRLESSLDRERAARTLAEEQLARERREAQQDFKARDELLKEKQNELYLKEELLAAQEAAVVDLRTALESLAQQREESEKALCEAREEAGREREARLAAEDSAERAASAQKVLEQQLVEQRHLEKRMQAHLAGINALCSRLQAKRAELVEP